MKNVTIENETNNIIVHGSVREAEAVPNSERFSNEAALAKLAANWPAARLVEIWNSLPGETPVRKFKDRATAVSRIWKAIQNLGQTAPAADELAPAPEVVPAAEVPESAPVAEQEVTETPQADSVTAESTEPAASATLAPHAPDVASTEPAAKKKATRQKKAPVAASAKDAGRPGRAARPSR